MKLDLPAEELRELVAAAVERLIGDELSAAIETEALRQAREALLWRSARQLREEFGLPERTLRRLVEHRKVSKSEGLGMKDLVRYSRPDVLTLLEKKQIKSTTAIEREKEAAKKVTVFPEQSRRAS